MAIPISYNLRNLFVRKTATLMTAGGIALVVAILIMSLALANGFRETLVMTGRDDNAIVIRTGSGTEVQSAVARDAAHVIEFDEAVARMPGGEPLAVSEAVVLTNLTRRGNPALSSNVVIRGVDERALALRPEVHITAGRFFRAGVDEVVVGRPLSERFNGCALGEVVRFGSRDWKVVGIIESGGSGFESEIWGDVESLMPAFDRDVFSSVTVRLANPAAFPAMKARMEADPRLHVDVKLESDYYQSQSAQLANVIRVLGLFLVIVMSAGAIFGALNTMYAAVGARTREIGTMLALGFTPNIRDGELHDRIGPPLLRRRSASAASSRCRSTASPRGRRTGRPSAKSPSSSGSLRASLRSGCSHRSCSDCWEATSPRATPPVER